MGLVIRAPFGSQVTDTFEQVAALDRVRISASVIHVQCGQRDLCECGSPDDCCTESAGFDEGGNSRRILRPGKVLLRVDVAMAGLASSATNAGFAKCGTLCVGRVLFQSDSSSDTRSSGSKLSKTGRVRFHASSSMRLRRFNRFPARTSSGFHGM